MGLWGTIKGLLGMESPPSLEELAFLQAIAAEPQVMQRRLEYANYLDAQRQPLGKFMRCSIALDELADDDRRQHELQKQCDKMLATYGSTWMRPLLRLGASPLFRRGMVEEVALRSPTLGPTDWERLFELAPALRKLSFVRCWPEQAKIASSPLLARIRVLDLSDATMPLSELATLLTSPYLQQLEELDVSNHGHGVELAYLLVKSPLAQSLRVLRADSCKLGADGARVLASSTRFANLESLNLSYNELGDEGAFVFGNSPTIKQLRVLDLSTNDLRSAGIQAIARGSYSQLETLRLESAGLDVAAARSLAKATFAPALRSLDIGWNRAGNEAITALLQPSSFSQLRTLRINGSDITDHGLRIILGSASLATVRELDLSSNNLGNAGVNAIIESTHLTNLQKLLMYSIDLSEAERQKLR